MTRAQLTLNPPGPSATREDALVACHECDRLHRVRPSGASARALCARCGALLYRHVPNSLERVLALNLTALLLFVLANVYPFLSLKLSGRVEENVLVSGAIALFRAGQGELGLLVLLTAVVFPLATIAGMLYLLVPLRLGRLPPGATLVFRSVKAVGPWSLLGVFMLGVLIAVVKLLDLASVIPGVSLFAFAALMFVSAAASANLDSALLWPPAAGPPLAGTGTTASEHDLVACHTCGMLVREAAAGGGAHRRCPRCSSPLHGRRKPDSVTRTWALVAAASLLLIPANVYPVMTVIRFGRGDPNTILSGVLHLIESGMWPLAMIVFVASIVVPLTKLVLLVYLLVSVQRRSSFRPRDRTRLYRLTEVVGAWSMVDIYLVAVLTALVNLQSLATIRPGIGASFFAAVVVITMFAAQSFDPRLIWDNAERSR